MFILYTKNGCPFCEKVKEFMGNNDLAFEEREISDDDNRSMLLEKGGKQQVPFLIDDELGKSMYESMDIITYLTENYVSINNGSGDSLEEE